LWCPLNFCFVVLNFAPGASLRTARDCFIAKIMCWLEARNLLSCEKRSRAVSKTDGHLKKTTRSCPSNWWGESSTNTRPSVEVYRGENRGKNAVFAPETRRFRSPNPRGDLGANLGHVIVSEHIVTAVAPWFGPAPPLCPEFKPTL
jgi:hypothetical protein